MGRRRWALRLRLTAIFLLLLVVLGAALGSRAPVFNAWSVCERLLGRAPSFAPSWAAATFGPLGEFVLVLAVASALGMSVAAALRRARLV